MKRDEATHPRRAALHIVWCGYVLYWLLAVTHPLLEHHAFEHAHATHGHEHPSDPCTAVCAAECSDTCEDPTHHHHHEDSSCVETCPLCKSPSAGIYLRAPVGHVNHQLVAESLTVPVENFPHAPPLTSLEPRAPPLRG